MSVLADLREYLNSEAPHPGRLRALALRSGLVVPNELATREQLVSWITDALKKGDPTPPTSPLAEAAKPEPSTEGNAPAEPGPTPAPSPAPPEAAPPPAPPAGEAFIHRIEGMFVELRGGIQELSERVDRLEATRSPAAVAPAPSADTSESNVVALPSAPKPEAKLPSGLTFIPASARSSQATEEAEAAPKAGQQLPSGVTFIPPSARSQASAEAAPTPPTTATPAVVFTPRPPASARSSAAAPAPSTSAVSGPSQGGAVVFTPRPGSEGAQPAGPVDAIVVKAKSAFTSLNAFLTALASLPDDDPRRGHLDLGQEIRSALADIGKALDG